MPTREQFAIFQVVRKLTAKNPKLYVKILQTTIQLFAHRVTRATVDNVQASQYGQPSLW